MSQITNDKYGIEKAFKDNFYLVPDYQREYVWQETQVIQLLEDIKSEYENNKNSEYYIGNIIVSPSSKVGFKDVIDGQQRLTTLFLIICAFRNILKDVPSITIICDEGTNADGYVQKNFKLALEYDGADEIIKLVFEHGKTPDEVKTILGTCYNDSFSLKNLFNAYDNIFQYLQNEFKTDQERRSFWAYIAHKVIFIQIEAEIGRALKIFETINERGVGLNPMDLLKNLLFTQVSKDEFNKLKNDWKKITAQLEKEQEKPLRFLRYFLMANYEVKNKDKVLREDDIYKWLTDNSAICGYKDDAFKFVKTINEAVGYYINFSKGKSRNGRDNIYLANLARLCGGAFSLHYILLLSAVNLPERLFNYLVQQIEVFLFYYIITKTSTKELERDFSKWADELCKVSKNGIPQEQERELQKFVNDRLKVGIDSKKDEFKHYFKEYDYNSLQKYRTRYILEKISQYADMQYRSSNEFGNLENAYNGFEIEHILPDTPTIEHKQDFESNSPEKNYDDYKIKLGNLTLLEKSINIVAGRDFFTDKIKEYSKSKCYLTSSISKVENIGKSDNTMPNQLAQKLKSFDTWTAIDIEERQNILLLLAEQIWNISPLVNIYEN